MEGVKVKKCHGDLGRGMVPTHLFTGITNGETVAMSFSSVILVEKTSYFLMSGL